MTENPLALELSDPFLSQDHLHLGTMLRLKGIIFEQILSDNFSRPTLLNQRRWLRKKSYLKNRHCKIVRLKMFDKTQI